MISSVLSRIALAFCCLTFATSASAELVVVMRLEDTIQPASMRYLQRGLRTAAAENAQLVVLELNTPGGLLTSLRQMTTAITTSPRPVVVYVTPSGAQAASAGFFLLMAADVAAMAPGTNAGAAHPVGGQGEDLEKTVAEKVTNDAAALIRSLAAQRGRPVEWAEKAVRESVSFTEREALEKKLIDLVAADRAELLRQLNGREVRRFSGVTEKLAVASPQIKVLVPSPADKLLSAIAHPNIAYLLLLLGILGIYFELSHPGAIFPGVLGAISLLLAFFALSVLPVNYVGVLLLLLAIAFFVAEVKVTSYGLLALAGVVCFILGSAMLIDAPLPSLRVGWGVILPTTLVFAFLVLFLLSRVLSAHRVKPVTGVEGMLGEEGRAVSDLSPRGKVFVHGEYWDAVAPAPVKEGMAVRVVGIRGSVLEVEAVPSEEGKGAMS
ncbi:MAG: nodulation protein NfeD [Thermoanaerobaculum sp.]|nr:nodulation protein NfeD [Thermoanaerobaculum sp.]